MKVLFTQKYQEDAGFVQITDLSLKLFILRNTYILIPRQVLFFGDYRIVKNTLRMGPWIIIRAIWILKIPVIYMHVANYLCFWNLLAHQMPCGPRLIWSAHLFSAHQWTDLASHTAWGRGMSMHRSFHHSWTLSYGTHLLTFLLHPWLASVRTKVVSKKPSTLGRKGSTVWDGSSIFPIDLYLRFESESRNTNIPLWSPVHFLFYYLIFSCCYPESNCMFKLLMTCKWRETKLETPVSNDCS